MALPGAGAERARRHRDRKRSGTVIVQDIEVERSAIDQLVIWGWLDAEVAHDPGHVRTALVDFVNDMLTEPSPGRFKQAIQALRVMSFGLF
jgi:hypothetical protein